MVPLLSSVATHQLPQMLRTATPASARVLSVARSIIIVYCSTLAAADDSICESTGARYGLAGMAPLLSSVATHTSCCRCARAAHRPDCIRACATSRAFHHHWLTAAQHPRCSRCGSICQQLGTMSHNAYGCQAYLTLRTLRLRQNRTHCIFCAARPPNQHSLTLQPSSSSAITHAALCDTALSSIQARSRTTKLLLSISYAACRLAAPKQMHHRFCGACVLIQHRSSCNSAPAAPAPALCSAAQHLPASCRDATAHSS
jgi:hypothetical protein